MNDINDKGVRFVRQISKLYADRYRLKWTKEGSVPSPNFLSPGYVNINSTGLGKTEYTRGTKGSNPRCIFP